MIVCQAYLLYIYSQFKQEFGGNRAYEETATEETSAAYDHCSHLPRKISENVKDCQDKLSALYWLS